MEAPTANLKPAAQRFFATIQRYMQLPVHERSRPTIVVECDKYEYGVRPSTPPEHGILIAMPAMSADTLVPAMFAKGGIQLLEEIQHSLGKVRSSKNPDKHIARTEKFLRKFTRLVERSMKRDAIINGQRDGTTVLPDLDDGRKVVDLVVGAFGRIGQLPSETVLSGKMLVFTSDNGLRLTEPDIEKCRNTVKIALPKGVTRETLLELLVNSAAAACIVGTLRACERCGISIDQAQHPIVRDAVVAIESGLFEISRASAVAISPGGDKHTLN